MNLHNILLEANPRVAIKDLRTLKKKKKDYRMFAFFGEVITQFTNHIIGESRHFLHARFPSWITSSRSFQLFCIPSFQHSKNFKGLGRV